MAKEDLDKKRKKERQELLLKLYQENQSFLNRVIFTMSALAIPLLFKTIPETENLLISILLFLSLSCFLVIIVLEIQSLKYARDGCELEMMDDKDSKKKGEKKNETARTLNACRDWTIFASLFFIFLSSIYMLEDYYV